MNRIVINQTAENEEFGIAIGTGIQNRSESGALPACGKPSHRSVKEIGNRKKYQENTRPGEMSRGS